MTLTDELAQLSSNFQKPNLEGGNLFLNIFKTTQNIKPLPIQVNSTNIGHSFILEHPINGILNTTGVIASGIDGSALMLGSKGLGASTISRVYNVENTWREYLRTNKYIDTTNTTASVDYTNHNITFGGGGTNTLLNGLVLYYTFDTPHVVSGNPQDVGGNGYHGTTTGCTTGATGKLSQCFSYDGTGDIVVIPKPLTQINYTAGFSVSWWSKSGDTSGVDVIWALLESYSIMGCENRLSEGNVMDVGIYDVDSAAWEVVSDTSYTTDWIHYVFTFDGTNMKLYKNGNTTPISTNTISTMEANSGNNQLSNTGATSFKGLIDEFGIWNRELTSAEVSTLYNGGSGISYPFE
jgi:hypothetical protein